jgi:hypothetical protein
VSSDPPVEIQAYSPDLGGYIVTGGPQAGSYNGLTAEQQADATAQYEAEAGG